MLYELYVENIALIDKMRLPLSAGMNALTGETGAGKSLVIDAVALLIGGRGSDSFIRAGADKALVEGVFLPPFPQQLLQLPGSGKDEDNIILSRELLRGGRSVARINGRVVNLSQLRAVGRLLVNIHGQQEHMLLLEEERQLALLDSYGGEPCLAALAGVRQAYARLREAEAQARDYEQNRQERVGRMEELRGLIETISSAELRPGEEEELKEEAYLLAHAEKLYQLAAAGRDALDGGAVERLNEAAAALRQASLLDKQAAALAERLSSLYYEAEDAAREIAAYRDGINLDAYRLDEVESRLALLGRLNKKYGGGVEAVLERLAAAQAEYSALEEISVSGDALYRALAARREEYARQAALLRKQRRAAADRLGRAVSRELQLLAMARAEFTVDLPEREQSAQGTEAAVFMIRPNRGEPAQPVSKIASGGELSRIVLGLKVILSQLEAVPTLVFDEIDTGLSGRALNAVAERLALVGSNAQAVVVSHAAAMAAAAGNQIVIEKHEEGERTVVTSRTLAREERAAELARMIAGDQVSALTLKQAEEMLNRYAAG